MTLLRPYAVTFANAATTTAADFFEITPADDKPVALLGVFIGQSTESGDAAAELLRWAVIRGFTSSGSGGSAPTPVALNPNDTAAAFTAETMNTTVATTGTTTTPHASTFHVATGINHWWTPETAPRATQGNTTIVVRLVSTPADSITFDGTLYVAEVA